MERVSGKNILEGLGVLALIASLLFVGFQLQQDRQLATAEVIASANAVTNEVLASIVGSRDVWLKGLKGEELSEIEEIEFRAVAAAVYRRRLSIYQRFPLLGYSAPVGMAQRHAIDLYQYPSLRRIFMQEEQLDDAQNLYFNGVPTQEFRVKVMESLVELDKAPPELPDKTYFLY